MVGPGAVLERDKCGEKLIGYYGCFGCHNIAGFENYAPIAPELTGWAKKDITKLDYGYAIDDHHLQTHETFLAWKLDSPRIYRRDRIELRMADFDLSPREIRALTVFVMGLVESKPLARAQSDDASPNTPRCSKAVRSSTTTTAAAATSSKTVAVTSLPR